MQQRAVLLREYQNDLAMAYQIAAERAQGTIDELRERLEDERRRSRGLSERLEER
jgi:hypothetical protein